MQGDALHRLQATFRTLITDRKMKGMFRTGWQMDYPSIENCPRSMAPVPAPTTVTTASAKFDNLLKEAAAAGDPAEANAKYQEAEAQPRLTSRRSRCGTADHRRLVRDVDERQDHPFGTIDVLSVTMKA